MTITDWLKTASRQLSAVNVGTARLDSEVLLSDELGCDRSWLLAHPETVLQGPTLQKLNKKIARRTRHEPLAYIRGFTEFYGRRFRVNKNVLEPRSESETMIDLLKELATRLKTRDSRQNSRLIAQSSRLMVADVGTGSGALAITAKLGIPEAEVVASDIDPKCLKVARQNAKNLGAKVNFYQGDLLRPIPDPSPVTHHLIMANLPYVPDRWKINQAAAMEPRLAIFGGPDGLNIYRRLFEQLSSSDHRPSYVLTEALPPQHQKLAQIAQKQGYKLSESQDFIQVFELNS